MKNINDIVCYDKNKLYDFNGIVSKFKEYFNLDIDEIENMLINCSIIEWEDVKNNLLSGNYNLDEIERRYFTYNYYRKNILNLKDKGIELTKLIKYLNDGNIIELDNYYEDILKSINIYHFGSLLRGQGINKILVVVYHLLINFYQLLEVIELADTYLNDKNLLNMTAIDIDGDTAYLNDSLIVWDNEYKNLLDKTSFIVNSNNIKVRSKMKIRN